MRRLGVGVATWRSLRLGVEDEAAGARAGKPGCGDGERKWGLEMA